jgi:hypothetical protein
MFKKKKSFSVEKKTVVNNLFGQARAGGLDNGESNCCGGKQEGNCAGNGNTHCCNK